MQEFLSDSAGTAAMLSAMKKVQHQIDGITKYLTPLLPLANCHMVEFLTDNHWETLLPEPLRNVLECSELGDAVDNFWKGARNECGNDNTELQRWINSAKAHHITVNNEYCLSTDQLANRITTWGGVLQHRIKVTEFMNSKKSYEVSTMSRLVSSLYSATSSTCCVEAGGGRGHLLVSLSLGYNVPSLTVDCDQNKVDAAMERVRIIQKQWHAIFKRITKTHESPTNNTAHTNSNNDHVNPSKARHSSDSNFKSDVHKYESNKNVKMMDKSCNIDGHSSDRNGNVLHNTNNGCEKAQNVCDTYNKTTSNILDSNGNTTRNYGSVLDTNGNSSESMLKSSDTSRYKNDKNIKVSYTNRKKNDTNINSSDSNGNQIDKDINTKRNINMLSNKEKCNSNLHRFATAFITKDTDLERVVRENFPENTGDIRILLTGLHTCGDLCPSSLRLFSSRRRCSALINVPCCYHLLTEHPGEGFPMSAYLKGYKLGRNARMLAAQSIDRVVSGKLLPPRSLLYRAMLQVLIKTHLPEQNVLEGKLKRLSKCDSFEEYFRTADAILDLGLFDRLPESCLIELYNNIDCHWRKLVLFYLLRLCLAQVVESLILLDRILYLYENGIEKAYLVKLFDPVLSPRCHGIVAVR